jgi:protein-tyrosine phosphatase
MTISYSNLEYSEEYLREIENSKIENNFKYFQLEYSEKVSFGERISRYPTGMSFENMRRNRYREILSEENSLVSLPDGEYINASRINTYSQSFFIATQCPIPETFPHFYAMLLSEKIEKIVCLCSKDDYKKLNDFGKSDKFDRYWPENETSSYGDVIVNKVSVGFASDNICVTIIEVIGIDQTIKVELIQYYSWEDNQLPSSSYEFELLMDMIHPNCRTVVHCSAGVGRTGTFIASHILKNYKTMENSISSNTIFNIVNDLRKCRMLMVKEFVQYKFLCDKYCNSSLFNHTII